MMKGDFSDLSDTLLENYPVFVDAANRLTRVVQAEGPIGLDDLIIRSRTPARTALLVLRHLKRKRIVGSAEGWISLPNDRTGREAAKERSGHRPAAGTHLLGHRYMEMTVAREEPCLLWGQRRAGAMVCP